MLEMELLKQEQLLQPITGVTQSTKDAQPRQKPVVTVAKFDRCDDSWFSASALISSVVAVEPHPMRFDVNSTRFP